MELRGHYEIIYADACSSWVSCCQWGPIQSQLLVAESAPLGSVAHTRPPIEHSQLRSRRSTKLGFEDYTACYGQEKKLWVNTAICLSLSLSPSISHKPQKLQPFSRIKFKSYILIKQCYGHSSSMYLPSSWLYNMKMEWIFKKKTSEPKIL